MSFGLPLGRRADDTDDALGARRQRFGAPHHLVVRRDWWDGADHETRNGDARLRAVLDHDLVRMVRCELYRPRHFLGPDPEVPLAFARVVSSIHDGGAVDEQARLADLDE